MNGAANSARGAAAERAVVNWLRANGHPDARRSGRGFAGSDVIGVHLTIEIKDVVASCWPTWCRQALAARRDTEPVIVVRRTRGRPDVAAWDCRWTTGVGPDLAWVSGEPFGHVIGLLTRRKGTT